MVTLNPCRVFMRGVDLYHAFFNYGDRDMGKLLPEAVDAVTRTKALKEIQEVVDVI